MSSVEELQGIVAGLMAIIKQQADAQKATNVQIAQLTEALIAHGGTPAAGPATSTSNTSLRMPALQLPQFRYNHSSYDDINEFLETFDVQIKRPIYQLQQNLLSFNSCVMANGQIQSCPWRNQNSPKKPQPSRSLTA